MNRFTPCLIIPLLICAGCGMTRPANGLPVVKEVADVVDNIPLGTSITNMPVLQNNLDDNMTRVTTFDVQSCLLINPLEQNLRIVLYRQKPSGVIMTLDESDYVVNVPVIERGDFDGFIFAFFDSEHKYIGYLAWSDYGRFKDPAARLEAEKKAFVDAGLDKECEFFKKNANKPKIVRQVLFKLPLSRNGSL